MPLRRPGGTVSHRAVAERRMGMAPDEAEQVRSTVRRLLDDGVQRRDPQAYFDRTYHPDVTIEEAPSLPYGGTYRGLDGAARHALGFTRTWDALQPTPAARRLRYAVHALPGTSFVTWSLSAVDPGTDRLVSFPAAPATGLGVALGAGLTWASWTGALRPHWLRWPASLVLVANAATLGGLFSLDGPWNSGNGILGGIALPLGALTAFVVAASLAWLRLEAVAPADRAPVSTEGGPGC